METDRAVCPGATPMTKSNEALTHLSKALDDLAEKVTKLEKTIHEEEPETVRIKRKEFYDAIYAHNERRVAIKVLTSFREPTEDMLNALTSSPQGIDAQWREHGRND